MGEGDHRPIRPHPSGTLSAKKRREAGPPLLSASRRTGPRASAPAPGSLPMKREGRRTNQSVCPPAITPFPPVIPGTGLHSRNQSRRASMQLSPPRSHPRRKAGPCHRRSQSTSLEASKSQPPKSSHTPPHLRPSSTPVKNSHAGVAAQRGNPCFA